jgi:glycosyltransferase involved in cell wall biosynthesis
VVIVDDGSTDGTPQLLEEYQRQTPLNLRCIRQENSGPARARNQAISVLRAPVCLIIGDDIFASPEVVSQHLQLHWQRSEIAVAGLGLTRWSESGQTVTPFMQWLDKSGVQFAYNDLFRGARPCWKYFYTCNLSLKTQLLRENPFNESFTKAAAEDIELGYRLERRRNLEVVFIPAALAHHLHPTSFRRACRRNITVGASMRLFHDLWPESAPPDKDSPLQRPIPRLMLRNPWLLSVLSLFADLLTRVWGPNSVMRETLSYYYNRGYQMTLSGAHNSKAS